MTRMDIEDPTGWPDASAPWRTADEPEWRRRVYALGWRARKGPFGKAAEYVLSGPCPRCGHQMTATAGAAVVLREDTTVETVRCNCDGAPHAGRPDARTGCGARGNIPIP